MKKKAAGVLTQLPETCCTSRPHLLNCFLLTDSRDVLLVSVDECHAAWEEACRDQTLTLDVLWAHIVTICDALQEGIGQISDHTGKTLQMTAYQGLLNSARRAAGCSGAALRNLRRACLWWIADVQCCMKECSGVQR